MKYVLVTGGVVSGLGKGVTASSIGVILKACGHRVTSIKIGKCGTTQRHSRQNTIVEMCGRLRCGISHVQ